MLPRVKAAVTFCIVFTGMLLPRKTIAQHVCSGGTGSPAGGATVHVWSNNFATGEYPGDSLPLGKTNYSYTNTACPAPGQYTIRGSVSNCFGYAVDTIPGGVSTNVAGGNFMLVNSAASPGGVVYRDTVTNLCGGTYYGFWVTFSYITRSTSCNGNPIMPAFTMDVQGLDGTEYGRTFATTNGVYHQNSTFEDLFSTPPGVTSVVVSITDVSAAGCGSVFGMAILAVDQCLPTITPAIESDQCTGANSYSTLVATVGAAYDQPVYQWQVLTDTGWADISGATALTYVASVDTAATATYRFVVAESGNMGIMSCRVLSDTIPILKGIPNAKVSASSNSPVCKGKTINLSVTGGAYFQWTGPGGFSSTDAEPSFASSGGAAGLYSVVVSDPYGCESTASTMVDILASPKATVSGTQHICSGDSVVLEAGGGTMYSWVPTTHLSAPGSSDPIASPLITTSYRVTVADSNYCNDTASVLVVVNPRPVVSAGGTESVLRGQSVTLHGSVNDTATVTYSWVPSSTLSDIHLLDPVASPDVNTKYVLVAMSIFGCGNTADTAAVIVLSLGVPGAFTPNGDGHNDVWRIPALQAFPNARVAVYNRYGQKVFESSGGAMEWDGRFRGEVQPSGAYVYVIDLRNNTPPVKGTVMIIR